MSEEKIVEDAVIAAGEFNPRGHSGAGFAGGLIGGGVGDSIDSPAGGIELEGMRLPITHSKDVIQELT